MNDDWSPTMDKKPLIKLKIHGVSEASLAGHDGTTCWSLARMKYTPVVQAWVRWEISRDETGEIFTLDTTYGHFDGGLNFMHAHGLAVLLANILRRDGPNDESRHPTATILATRISSYAIGTLRRRADAEEAPLRKLHSLTILNIRLLCCRLSFSVMCFLFRCSRIPSAPAILSSPAPTHPTHPPQFHNPLTYHHQ